ncbi:hypothetical protein AAEO56_06765 [Flavobacterium sp. DGU11]|uniref:Outer membrane protein beta-barrel domain-containing protein n=1 Tax=Flavobacterium arundinis TaxID=3139143 RepID=A0ABU9HUY4_9FLAO
MKIDMSPSNVKRLSGDKEPHWVLKTVFLNILVEGASTLYSYRQSDGIKYFYSVNNKKDYPEQLVYKKYKQTESTIAENKQFRQQLFNNINCENKGIEEFTNINYSEDTFVKLFKSNNTCAGSESVEYTNDTAKKIKTVYTVYAGLGNMSFGIKGSTLESGKTNDLNYSAGAEIAFRMPSDKWEFFFRGEYEKMSSDITYKFNNTTSRLRTRYKLDSSNINFYLGPRYNLIINAANKIFIDGAFGMNFPFGNIENSTFLFGDPPNSTSDIEIKTSFFANFGVGYVFNDKYGICVRYETNRNMFTNSPTADITQISRVMLNLRYSF